MSDNPNDLGLMTLKGACEKIFSGELTPSSLRTEAAKGNLEIIQIARKDSLPGKLFERWWRSAGGGP